MCHWYYAIKLIWVIILIAKNKFTTSNTYQQRLEQNYWYKQDNSKTGLSELLI